MPETSDFMDVDEGLGSSVLSDHDYVVTSRSQSATSTEPAKTPACAENNTSPSDFENSFDLKREFYGLISPGSRPLSPPVFLRTFHLGARMMMPLENDSEATQFRAGPITRARKRSFNFPTELVDTALATKNGERSVKNKRIVKVNTNFPSDSVCDSLLYRLKQLPDQIRSEAGMEIEQIVSHFEAKNAREQLDKTGAWPLCK